MLDKKWSVVNSIKHASFGIWVAFRDEQNMRIHGILTLLAIIMMIALKVSTIEGLVLGLDIALVWVAELMNTSIEESFNIHGQDKNPQIKIGKDVAAGAVLIASLNALIAALIIFLPKLNLLLR
ncbi:diacylglycerol kinase family protein [Candidatus Margulisiibacteriota bacterium]